MTNPDGYTALDLVGYTDQGDYDATKSYVANDLVHYDGSIWCCLIDDTVGITPTEGVNWRFWVENSQNGISDIVNVLGAKNLIPFPYADGTSKTRYGITFTVGEKGKVTVSGTSTGAAQFFFIRVLQLDNPAILSLKSDGAGTNITLVAFNGSTFYTANTSKSKALPIGTYNVYLLVQEGSTADDTVYPMIRPSGIEDDTYVPYVKTNKELTAEVTQNSSDIQTLTNETATMNNVLGAKNLLNNSLTTQVNYGVTYTKNADGSILVSGTATGRYSGVAITPTIHLPKGKYILSGCPSGGKVGDTVKYNLYVNDDNSTIAMDTGDGAEFELLVDTDVHASIAIAENETVNATYYPMIRPSSIVDSTYVPYAMTNRALTEMPRILKAENVVLTFSNGVAKYDISSLGLSYRPMALVVGNATTDSATVINTDIMNSSASAIKLRGVITSSKSTSALSGSVRLLIAILNVPS